jgi:hypothetical protein
MTVQLFDWPLFVLLFGSLQVSAYAQRFHHSYAENQYWELPSWAMRPKAHIILMLINLPGYWSNIVVLIYGCFTLPWYTVLLSAVLAMIVARLFDALFFTPIIGRFGVFAALLVSYIIAALTALWHFGFIREMRPHTLDLGSYLGIGVCACFIARALFLGCLTLPRGGSSIFQ